MRRLLAIILVLAALTAPVATQSTGLVVSVAASVNDAVTEVLKLLHEQSVEGEKIDIRRPTLEDTFLKLIRRNARGGNG